MGDEKSFTELYESGKALSSGGVVGGWLCNVLVPVIGKPLTGIISGSFIIVFISFLIGMTPGDFIRIVFPKKGKEYEEISEENIHEAKESKVNTETEVISSKENVSENISEKDRPKKVVNMRDEGIRRTSKKGEFDDERTVFSDEDMDENYLHLKKDQKARKKNPFFVDIEFDENSENAKPLEGEDIDKVDLHTAAEEVPFEKRRRKKKNIENTAVTEKVSEDDEDCDIVSEIFKDEKEVTFEDDEEEKAVNQTENDEETEDDDDLAPWETEESDEGSSVSGKERIPDIRLKGKEDVKNLNIKKDTDDERSISEQLSDIFDEEEDEDVKARFSNSPEIIEDDKAEITIKIEEDEEEFYINTEKKEITSPENEVKGPQFEKPLPSLEEEKKPEYIFPPLSLLHLPETRNNDSIDEQKEVAKKLMETLSEFKVSATMRDISKGPAVTRYELQPALGVRVKSIESLSSDIARALSAKSIRIEAPIPGKDTVGVEIPNKSVSTVYIRGLIDSDGFKNAKSKVTACLGEDITGSPVFCDISKMPHLLIAGATGTGKSVCINSLIVSILYKAKPDEVKFIMIDPKKVELSIYNGIPHLLVPTVTDPKKAAGSLAWAVNEMERRFSLLEEARVRNLAFYNKSIENDPEKQPLPHIVIIIDELADLMLQAKDEVETSINRLAAKARAAGMHLVIGTQRPSTDVITGLIKANIPSRIACTVSSMTDSRVILDSGGAEKLLGRGDMLYAPVGEMKHIRVQGCFVSEEEVEAVTDFIKSDGETVYSQEILESIEKEAAKCGEKKKNGSVNYIDGSMEHSDDLGSGGEDPLLYSAIKVAVENKGVATSLLQRKLSIGYSRAAKLIDTMEMMRVIGGPNGSKPRELLITYEQYLEMMQNKLS
ncbi:MAG: DNA translocase FtsK [Ruminococcaceae bacterium]|nr:DNA translocase FtsK [Oscillospiraceae bacterium]